VERVHHSNYIQPSRLAASCAIILALILMPSRPIAQASADVSATNAAAPSSATPAPPLPALVAYTNAWRRVTAYSATATIFEQKGAQTQKMVFAYNFAKPSNVSVRVAEGANTGARLLWTGGSTVDVRRGGGLLSLLKKTVSLHDPLVTTIRGSSIDQLGFGAILAHAQCPGVLSQSPGGLVDGAATDAITLIPSQPPADADLTREVIDISTTTHLPTRVLGYEGRMLAREIDFSDVHLTF
jgi:hypothetical protein